MIVRDGGDHWLLITQPDHARLARQVMDHWPALAVSPRRDEVLLAIGEHDCGWAEADAAPMLDAETGGVVDFVHAPLSVRQAAMPAAVARLGDVPWAAALIAQHGVTVYDRFRPQPEWAAYFAGLEQSRDQRLHETGRAAHLLLEDYAWLRLADLISLTFCAGWETVQRYAHWSVARTGARVLVTGAEQALRLPLRVEAVRLAKAVYRTDAELRRAWAASPRVVVEGEVVARG
jgi:hypothetical protein